MKNKRKYIDRGVVLMNNDSLAIVVSCNTIEDCIKFEGYSVIEYDEIESYYLVGGCCQKGNRGIKRVATSTEARQFRSQMRKRGWMYDKDKKDVIFKLKEE